MDNYKPRAGIILASHIREPTSFSMDLMRKAVKLLKDKNIDVLFNGKALINDREIRSEIRRLKNSDPDLFIIVPGNWIEPPVLGHPMEEIRDDNILLWGFPESLKLIRDGHFLGSNSAFTVLRNAMRQMKFKFKAIQKFPEDKNLVKEIKDYLPALTSLRSGQFLGQRSIVLPILIFYMKI